MLCTDNGLRIWISHFLWQFLFFFIKEIHFSHLIIATGSDGPFPGKFNKAVTKEMAIQLYEDLVKEVSLKVK